MTEKHGGQDNGRVVPSTSLAKRLIEARQPNERRARKLTQPDMADELGISLRQIVRYEKGDHAPSRATLIAWAEVTSTDFWWLSGETRPVDDLERRRSARRTHRPTDRYPRRRSRITLVAA